MPGLPKSPLLLKSVTKFAFYLSLLVGGDSEPHPWLGHDPGQIPTFHLLWEPNSISPKDLVILLKCTTLRQSMGLKTGELPAPPNFRPIITDLGHRGEEVMAR